METHSAWYLIPPVDAVVNWDSFPEDVQHARPLEDGFRGFVVEFYNVISDVVVQDGYQSVLNLRTVLSMISKRHPRIETCVMGRVEVGVVMGRVMVMGRVVMVMVMAMGRGVVVVVVVGVRGFVFNFYCDP